MTTLNTLRVRGRLCLPNAGAGKEAALKMHVVRVRELLGPGETR
jgi:hypothetical protein